MSDIREAAAEMRGMATAARPQTDLQRRLESELQMHHEVRSKRRESGGPDDMSEIDRELTMATGALEGLYQRIGTLAAALQPVLNPNTVGQLIDGPGRVDPRDAYETNSEVGQRIAKITRAIAECEDVVGSLAVNVRV